MIMRSGQDIKKDTSAGIRNPATAQSMFCIIAANCKDRAEGLAKEIQLLEGNIFIKTIYSCKYDVKGQVFRETEEYINESIEE